MTINIAGLILNIFELPTIMLLSAVIIFDLYFYGSKIIVRTFRSYYTYILLFLLFFCAILLSGIFAVKLELIFKSFVKWIEIFVISMLVFFFVRNEKRFKIIYWLILLSTLSSIVYVLVLLANDWSLFLNERIFPGYDSLFSFILILPFVLSRNKKMMITAALLVLICAILSLSRGVWIGLLVSLFYFSLHYKKNFFIKVISVSILLITVSIVIYEPIRELFVYRITEIFTLENISNVERIVMIKYALFGFSNSPIFGIGALNFPYFILSEGLLEGIVANDIHVLAPHNFFLQILTEEGIIGFIIICLLLLNVYNILFKDKLTLLFNNSDFKLYLLGLRILFIAIFLNLLLGFIANQFRFNFALFLGLSLSLTRFDVKTLLSNNFSISK